MIDPSAGSTKTPLFLLRSCLSRVRGSILWAPGTRKQGSSTLCSALAASLPDSTDPRSTKRQDSASGDDLRESQRPSSLVPNGGQDHGGVPKEDGNGEPGYHPADA